MPPETAQDRENTDGDVAGAGDTLTPRFRDRFFAYEPHAHGVMWFDLESGEKRGAKTKDGPPSADDVRAHLEGEMPGLGALPLRGEGKAIFAALDLDDPDADHAELAQAVAQAELPLTVARSKSGGAHLYAFPVGPVSAYRLRVWLQYVARQLGLRNPDGREVEIFPKHGSLEETDGGVGNWINLPYFGSSRPAFGDDGEPLTLAQFLDRADRLAFGRVPDAPGIEDDGDEEEAEERRQRFWKLCLTAEELPPTEWTGVAAEGRDSCTYALARALYDQGHHDPAEVEQIITRTFRPKYVEKGHPYTPEELHVTVQGAVREAQQEDRGGEAEAIGVEIGDVYKVLDPLDPYFEIEVFGETIPTHFSDVRHPQTWQEKVHRRTGIYPWPKAEPWTVRRNLAELTSSVREVEPEDAKLEPFEFAQAIECWDEEMDVTRTTPFLIYRDSVNLLVGEKKLGKSELMATDIVRAVREDDRRPVWITEMSKTQIGIYLYDAGAEMEEMADAITVISLPEVAGGSWEAVEEQVKIHEPSDIYIDTLFAFVHRVEPDPPDHGQGMRWQSFFTRYFKRWAAIVDGGVVIAHHTPRGDTSRARGSGQIEAGADFITVMERPRKRTTKRTLSTTGRKPPEADRFRVLDYRADVGRYFLLEGEDAKLGDGGADARGEDHWQEVEAIRVIYEEPGLTAGKVDSQIGGRAQDVADARRTVVELGFVHTDRDGRKKLHYPNLERHDNAEDAVAELRKVLAGEDGGM